MKSKLLILGVLLSGVASSFADTGGYAAAFLKLPVYPRGIALGGAFVALADDPSALHWNPAGLAELSKTYFSVSYSKLTLDRYHNFGAFAIPIGETYNCVAIGVNNFMVRDIVKRDPNGNELGKFNDSESAIVFSLASSLVASEYDEIFIDMGFSLKALLHSFDDAMAKGFSMDIGVIANFQNQFKFGFVLYDPFGKLWWNTGRSERIPQRLQAGIAWAGAPVHLELDINYNMLSESKGLSFGAELPIANAVFIRAGYNTIVRKPSFGIGVSTQHFTLDYAYSEDQLELNKPLHHMGIMLKF